MKGEGKNVSDELIVQQVVILLSHLYGGAGIPVPLELGLALALAVARGTWEGVMACHSQGKALRGISHPYHPSRSF